MPASGYEVRSTSFIDTLLTASLILQLFLMDMERGELPEVTPTSASNNSASSSNSNSAPEAMSDSDGKAATAAAGKESKEGKQSKAQAAGDLPSLWSALSAEQAGEYEQREVEEKARVQAELAFNMYPKGKRPAASTRSGPMRRVSIVAIECASFCCPAFKRIWRRRSEGGEGRGSSGACHRAAVWLHAVHLAQRPGPAPLYAFSVRNGYLGVLSAAEHEFRQYAKEWSGMSAESALGFMLPCDPHLDAGQSEYEAMMERNERKASTLAESRSVASAMQVDSKKPPANEDKGSSSSQLPAAKSSLSQLKSPSKPGDSPARSKSKGKKASSKVDREHGEIDVTHKSRTKSKAASLAGTKRKREPESAAASDSAEAAAPEAPAAAAAEMDTSSSEKPAAKPASASDSKTDSSDTAANGTSRSQTRSKTQTKSRARSAAAASGSSDSAEMSRAPTVVLPSSSKSKASEHKDEGKTADSAENGAAAGEAQGKKPSAGKGTTFDLTAEAEEQVRWMQSLCIQLYSSAPRVAAASNETTAHHAAAEQGVTRPALDEDHLAADPTRSSRPAY